ncbi:MAG: hypothetical protein A2937_02785 [Candidatus Yonathbacteria bacterium RIFCSPLOWO2_01_FULL_47_33b]|uniref:DUF4325 domain-containing protein n=1 Tax=Candidatus Yonathbacteria bacterium RIFCSPLOWO2_01_FULL_47_33b TaxID=1802727 RepID=A0A1G2SG90_9BACT|nr:MAG: hypothetical protein A2937_02785 [Candidatus Yonathbacteria bacterium RIFCSPLOWO2_01_FULL_47_33b]
MLNKEKILKIAKQKGLLKSAYFVAAFSVTRQYVSKMLSELVAEGKLIKIGSTRNAAYVLPEYADSHPDTIENRYTKKLENKSLEEHKVLDDVERSFLPFKKLPENIKSIFTFAFSEMLNNAIEHSKSEIIQVTVLLKDNELSFVIDDYGVGVYRNIMRKRNLNSEIEAIQDLLKGKMTTAPKLHSGEGIFFTSKVGDLFVLDSYGYQYIADNKIKDIFVKKIKGIKKGTKVSFKINIKDKHHLNDIFKKYTNLAEDSDYGFDKTEIRVRLYTMGGVHISRSQARRVLSGLEKFRIIVMDYDRVPMIGQAFADEVYRVFQEKRPDIVIQDTNMNEAVKFMVERAKNEAKKSLQ